jgi:hypothetical protein
MFKAAGGWIFKHFFDDSAIFRELADHYNKDLYRFEFKTVGERNNAIKLLELRGFDVELVEDPRMLRSAMRRHFHGSNCAKLKFRLMSSYQDPQLAALSLRSAAY